MKTQSVSASRFYGLDTLRAVAIVLVMLYHLSILQGLLPAALEPVAAVGWIGVDLFFVLSGFLIGSQLLKPYLAGSGPSLREFYARRAYRILPAYLVVLGLYYAAPVWREAKGPSGAWQFFTFTWNIFLRGYPEQRAFSHVWSLCVEEHFYLLLPVLLLVAMRRPRVWKAAVLLVGIVVGGIVLRGVLLERVVLAAGEERDTLFMRYIYYPTYTRLDGLAVGVGLAVMRSFRPAWWAKVAGYGNVCCVAGVAAVIAALWLCGFGFPGAELPGSVLFALPLLAVGFGLLVASAVSRRSILHRRVPGAASVAALAYSLYLTHKSVAHALHRLLPVLTAQADWRAAGIYAVGCVGFAALLYFGVERPFLRLRDRRVVRTGRTKN